MIDFLYERKKRCRTAYWNTTRGWTCLRTNSQILYRNHVRKTLWSVDGLSQTCKRVCMGCGWAVADVREGFHGIWSGCRRRARWIPWGVDGLSQTCERAFIRCGWFITSMREGLQGVRMVCRRPARGVPWGVDGLSQTYRMVTMVCGQSVTDV